MTTDAPTPFSAAVEHVLTTEDPIDLHTLAQAMDVILARPKDATREEMLAVIRFAAPVVGRFIMLRGGLVDEVLKADLEEAEPEGNA